MNDYYQKLKVQINKEYSDFYDIMLKKTKEEIFNEAYEIRFYREMSDYLTSENMEDFESSIPMILREKNILESMYRIFLKNEYASIENYENIGEFIRCDYLYYLKKQQQIL